MEKFLIVGFFLAVNWALPILYGQQTGFLGKDTLICGGTILLDAGFPGNQYLWSTGASTQTVMINTTDTVWVEITDGSANVLGRDTLVIEVIPLPGAPMASDTTLCGGGEVELTANSLGAQLTLWFDSLIGGNLLAAGDTGNFNLLSTTTLYVEAQNQPQLINTRGGNAVQTSVRGLEVPGTSGNGNYFSIGDQRGVVFDVLESFRFVSVELFADAALGGTLELRNGSGQLLLSQPVTVIQGGGTLIPLNVDLLPGNGYQLLFQRQSGAGKLYVDTQPVYPLQNDEIRFVQGIPITSHYNFFYNWKIEQVYCASQRTPVTANVVPSPTVELGNDTLLCGSTLSLDVTFPGASYLWQDGSVDPTYTVSTTDTIFVLLDLDGCLASDTISIEVLPTPILSNPVDAFRCGPGEVTVSASGNGAKVGWFADSLSKSIVLQGDSLSFFTFQDSMVFAEAQQFPNGVYANGGNATLVQSAGLSSMVGAGFFSISDERGMEFDAFNDFVISSVDVISDGPLSGICRLRDAQGQILQLDTVNIPSPGVNTVSINFRVLAGNDYRLTFQRVSGIGRLAINTSAQFPYGNDLVTINRGTPIPGHYSSLFSWELKDNYCASNRSSITATVAPSPEVNLGRDTLLCGGNLILDAFYPGATYVWQDGSTQSEFTLFSTDTVWVEATLGACQESDTLVAEILAIPSEPFLPDTSLCGPGEITLEAQTSVPTVAWYQTSIDSLPISTSNPATFNVIDTTTFWAETYSPSNLGLLVGGNGKRIQRTGLLEPFNSAASGYFSVGDVRGIKFDVVEPILLESVKLALNGSVSGILTIRNAIGDTLFSQSFTVSGPLATLDLQTGLAVGNNYSISFLRTGGGALFINTGNPYPVQNDWVVIREGFPNANHYNYLYDWRISQPHCSSNRLPLKVSVEIPLQLPTEIHICKDTLLQIDSLAQSYLWNTGATSSNLFIDSAGLYILTASNSSGCSITDSIQVSIPESLGLPNDGVLCGPYLSIPYYSDSSNIIWSTGDSTNKILVDTLGQYTVSVLEPKGCLLQDTVLVTGIDSLPDVSLGDDTSACVEAKIQVQNPEPSLTYVWNTGQTDTTITVVSSGTYIVSAINTNSCQSNDTIAVSIREMPSANFVVGDTVAVGEVLPLINLSSFGSYLWDFGDGNTASGFLPNHTYSIAGTYTVQLIVTNDCGSDTLQKTIIVQSTSSLSVLPTKKVFLYPNPVQDITVLQWELSSQLMEIQLWDMQVRQIWTREISAAESDMGEVRVWLASLPAGTYFIRGLNERGQLSFSFPFIKL